MHVFTAYGRLLMVCRNVTFLQGPVARSDARPPGMRTVAGSILGSGNILSLKLVMKSFYAHSLSTSASSMTVVN